MPPPFHRFAHQAMATYFEAIIDEDNATYAGQAAQAVFAEVDRLETLLTRFRPTSDLSQVNRLKPGESVKVTLDLFECLAIAQEVHEKTGGAFDPTVGPLMNSLRGENGVLLNITNKQRAEALARVGMKRIELDRQNLTVTLAPSAKGGAHEAGPVGLDLGGIGKGYALDRGAEILRDWGIESALIHSGTSTALAIGSPRSFPPGEEGWVIGTGGEWREAVGFGTVRIRNEALSGSSKRLKGEHILDPRTGYPAREHLAAWSLAPSAAVADALSTAFMVMSTAEVMELCKSMAAVGGLVIVPRQGILGAFSDEAIATPEFRARAVKIAATDS